MNQPRRQSFRRFCVPMPRWQLVKTEAIQIWVALFLMTFVLPTSWALEIFGEAERWEALIMQSIQSEIAGDLDSALESAEEAYREVSDSEDGLNSSAHGFSLYQLGNLHLKLGQFDMSEPLLHEALGIFRMDEELTPNEKWRFLGFVYRGLITLYEMKDRPDLAETYLKKLVNPPEYARPLDLERASNIMMLAEHYLGTSQLDEAQKAFNKLLSIRSNRLKDEEVAVLSVVGFTGLANVSYQRSDYDGAELFIGKVFDNLNKAPQGLIHGRLASILELSGQIKFRQGFYAAAEHDYREALKVEEKNQNYGVKHLDIIFRLTEVFWELGRLDEAEGLLTQTLNEIESKFGRDHSRYRTFLFTLTQLLDATGQQDASKSLEIANRLLEGAKSSIEKVGILNTTGDILFRQGKIEEAIEKYQEAWVQIEYQEDQESLFARALTALNLGYSYLATEEYDKARQFLKMSLSLNQKIAPSGNLLSVKILGSLGELEMLLQRSREELAHREQATSLIEKLLLLQQQAFDQTTFRAVQEVGSGHFLRHLDNLFQKPDAEATDETYGRTVELFQLMNNSEVDEAVRRMAVRKLQQDASLGDLIRDVYDKIAELKRQKGELDEKLARVKTDQLHDRKSSLFEDFAETERELRALLTQIDKESPGIAILRPSSVVSLQEIQAVLRQGEVLMMALPSESALHDHLVWFIKSDAVMRYPINPPVIQRVLRGFPAFSSGFKAGDIVLNVDGKEIYDWRDMRAIIQRSFGTRLTVRVLRGSEVHQLTVTPTSDSDAEAQVSGKIGIESSEGGVRFLVERLRNDFLSSSEEVSDFSPNLTYSLYKTLFGPAGAFFDDINRLLVVSIGPLESLPLHLLITDDPGDQIIPAPSLGKKRGFSVTGESENSNANKEAFNKIAWLAKKFSITTLPSVSSLRALRTVGKESEAPEPFIGFGNPKLNNDVVFVENLEITSLFRGARADVERVRQLPSLPETEQELRDLAAYLGGHKGALYLQDEATETNLKNVALDQSRVVAFATHGLMSGEIEGLAEPALVLTPPAIPTEQDDGLLTASEIAQLELDADLVILSACNTAAGKEVGAKGFSGLAKSFFYAGARSLLVSHWPVESNAAAQL